MKKNLPSSHERFARCGKTKVALLEIEEAT